MASSSATPRSPLLVSVLFVMGLAALQGAVLRVGAADTITVDRPFRGSQGPLVSKGGKFALGFFQPDSSQRWYLGIWYNQISKQTPVWVANRNSPISNPELSQLAISNDGSMVLLDHSRTAIWCTNNTKITSNPTAGVILDTGNLVLADASNASIVLWQSFDHLGNTWLPGGKLRRSKLTGVSTRLVAWKAYNDPAPGVFSLEQDPNGTSQYFLHWNNTQQYWTSGNWTGHTFSGVPEMTPSNAYPNSMYTFGYVDGENESYFVYDVKGGVLTTRFVVDVTGMIQALVWLEGSNEWMLFFSEPKTQCGVYSLGGAFSVCTENALASCSCLRGFSEQYQGEWLQGDHTVGCRRNVGLQCSNNGSQKDRFYSMANVKPPSNAQDTVAAGSTQACELACLSNCSCTAYSFNGSCSLWYGDLINLRDVSSIGSGDGTIQIRLAASEFSGRKHTKKLITGVVVATVATSVVLMVFVSVFFVRRIRRRFRLRAMARAKGSLTAFTYRELQSLTNHFSEKLGGGGFGSVFRGSLPDSTAVAVKQLEGVRQGEKQFRSEVSTVGSIQHVNLIRLLGFCSERTRRLLVYEYMPNSSLDRCLFESSHAILSWSRRYKIALGIARGLDYLHEKCRDCIVHCDIKPENILLDESFVPKVADFGLAKLIGRDFGRVLTTVRGTVGYLAPEWIAGMAITAKADVYSYGMTLFEIVSGRRNAERREDGMLDYFPLLATSRLADGDLDGLVDGRLGGDVDAVEVERACRVAGWCIQDDERARPAMATVVQVLEGLVEINVPPVPRSLKLAADPANWKLSSDLPSR